MCQKQKVTVQKRLFIFYIRSKYAYFKYRTIFFMIQTICQTYSDIEYESLCVILARNVLNGIKDIKLIDVYLYNRYILVSLQKNNITMIH